MTTDIFILRLFVALLLGIALGLDREVKRAPVGVRTFGLVSMGAAAYVMLSLGLGQAAVIDDDPTSADPSRAIQGLIGGIGFLGAGAIIGGMSDNKIRGIATGAAIWVAGAIGAACGLGLYWEAAAVTGAAIILLVVSELAQVRWGDRDNVVRDEKADD